MYRARSKNLQRASPALGRTLELILLVLYVILAVIYTLQLGPIYKMALKCKVTAAER